MRDLFSPFWDLYTIEGKTKGFIRKIVDTRNFLTHFDDELEKRAAKGRDLYVLYMKLEALLQLHFLSLIGLEEQSIWEITKCNRNLKWKLEL